MSQKSNSRLITLKKKQTQKQPPEVPKQSLEVFCKKMCSKNFANFSGEHLCWRIFKIKLQAFTLQDF